MYYPDLSCNVSETFNKIESLGISKSVPIDWMGIISMTKTGKILIDGGIDYANIGSSTVLKLLAEKSEVILNLEKGNILRSFKTIPNSQLEMIVMHIRKETTYQVIFVCISQGRPYCEKDLLIVKVLIGIYYENVLLNNTMIQEKNYLQNVFNSTESAIISIGLDGVVTTANKAALDIFGLTHEKMIGNKDYEFLPGDEEKRIISEGITYVVENNKNYFVKEVIFNSKDSGKRAINLIISPLNNSKYNVVGVVLIISDITTKKIMEKEIEQLKQFAILGELAAGIAHDIKNPLMSIRGSARIIQKTLSKDLKYLEYQEFIEPIISEVDRINEIIEQMLSYGVMTKENTYTLLNIAEVLDKCCNVINFHKELKYIRIEKFYSNNLPLIKGNNVQLQQAFINILLNAVQAIKSEGVIKIDCAVDEETKELVVIINDNGIGISAENMEDIFTPFYSTKNDGTGFGLSIVKRVIKKHQGDICVESNPKEGTSFKIHLPLLS